MNFVEPKVEQGIPIPLPPKPRKWYKRGPQGPSPWLAFIAKLKSGDSFVTFFSEHNTVEKYLNQLGIKYERRKCVRGQRFWIVENDYVPPFKDMGDGI